MHMCVCMCIHVCMCMYVCVYIRVEIARHCCDNVNNLTIKLRTSYNSLYQRIQKSNNSLIVQLYYYNVLCPSQLFTNLTIYESVFR